MNERVEFLKTGAKQTISDIAEIADDIQSKCTDYSILDANSKNLHFNPYSNGVQFVDDRGSKCTMSLTPYALQQLCGKIGVPTRYIEKCIESGMPDLAADNMNEWIDEYHKNLFIRGYDNNVRGVLSDKYTTLDAPQVLEVLSDSIPDDQYSIKGSIITPERMHLRIVQNEMMKIKGEDLFAGVSIDSSDVGRSTLLCRFFIYKQVCTNGMCISQSYGILFQQRHIGINQSEFREGLTDGMKKIPTLITDVMGLIKEANSDSAGYDIRHLNENSQNVYRGRIRAITRLQEKDIDKLIDTMYNKYSVTRWGLINSITEVAQDFTLERRLELEDVASNLLVRPSLLQVA